MRALFLLLLLSGCMRDPVRVVIKTKPENALQQKGQQVQLRAVAYDSGGLILDTEDFVWTSAQTAVAEVDSKGVLTAKSSGSSAITVTSGGKTDSFDAHVQIVGSVEVNGLVMVGGAVPKLKLGKAVTLSAVVKDDKGAPIPDAKVRWSTSTHALDLASSGGKTIATAQALGECEVYAESQGKIGSVRLTTSDR